MIDDIHFDLSNYPGDYKMLKLIPFSAVSRFFVKCLIQAFYKPDVAPGWGGGENLVKLAQHSILINFLSYRELILEILV